MNKLGTIEREGFPGPEWFRGGNYEGLRWEERHYTCPKHGPVQVHEADLLHAALNPSRRRIMARSVRRLGEPLLHHVKMSSKRVPVASPKMSSKSLPETTPEDGGRVDGSPPFRVTACRWPGRAVGPGRRPSPA
jgi:hypothetical protein